MADEDDHLGEADRHIGEAERRISAQELCIEKLKVLGTDTSDAERLLENLRQTLVEMQTHRRAILDEIARNAKLNR